MTTEIVKYLYSIFLAILIVTFVGVGIAAFYKVPTPPEFPLEPIPVGVDDRPVQPPEAREKYEEDYKKFSEARKSHEKNVSTIAIISSLVILTISITLLSKIDILSNGLLLGAVFTLIYGIIRGFGADDDMFRFLTVTVGLAVALFLGYWKFLRKTK